MQTENGVADKKPVFSAWMFEVLKERYGSISTSIIGLAPLAGLTNLLVYSHHIGRPDVFMPALEVGPGLVLLWLAYILLFAVLIGSMSITSLVLALGLRELRPKPESAGSVVLALTGITALAMLGIMIPVGVVFYRDEFVSLWWAMGVFIPPALCSWPFMRWSLTKVESFSGDVKRSQMLFACLVLTALVGFTALLSTYPAWYVTTLHRDQQGFWGSIGVLAFCFIAMLGSLAPAIGYYKLMAEGRAAQIKGAFVGIVLFMGGVSLMVPALLSFPSVIAVKLLGVSDREINRYLILNEEYPADTLDAERWSVSRSEGSRYLIHGFALYATGSVKLLCPADLAKIKEREIAQYSSQCIPFEKSAVKALDGVARKTGREDERP